YPGSPIAHDPGWHGGANGHRAGRRLAPDAPVSRTLSRRFLDLAGGFLSLYPGAGDDLAGARVENKLIHCLRLAFGGSHANAKRKQVMNVRRLEGTIMLAALDPFEHVLDTTDWHLIDAWNISIHLPKIFGLQITKFMVLQLIAAGVILAIFIPIARR